MEQTKSPEQEATCKMCKEQFTPYETDTDCRMCHDGDYESDVDRYDDLTDIISCPFCGGSGSHTAIEKNYCHSCSEYLEYED